MKSLQKKHLILITLNAMAWTIVGLMKNGTIEFSAKARIGFELISTPNRVRVTVNGTPFNTGHYVTTPIIIPTTLGSNKVMVQRAGYISNSSTVVVESPQEVKQKIEMLLEASTPNLKRISIESSDPEALSHLDLSISGGLETGKIPFEMDDLIAGTHTLEITSGLWSKPVIKCQFEIPVEQPEEEPVIIKIEPQGKKIRIQGCKKI
ncbi:MAG: hypothetical protein NT027_09300 [Proteobacteria bacterium]|nr:hypothetical protein [Pseudomonadota bacterium]